ncbi:GNAT family N-acetyltransferase [Shewanella maritima]|nr:GNAT family N-acetyltransferase [Shewanella maritima]
MIFRKATREDAPAVFDIRNRAIMALCTKAYPVELMQRWTSGDLPEQFIADLAAHGYVLTDAKQAKVLVSGMLVAKTDETDIGLIDAIFTEPNYTGTGLGFQMMMHLEALAKGLGIKRLQLDATLNAAGFYRRCGFKGEQQSIYHSPRGFDLACIPMHKQLSD